MTQTYRMMCGKHERPVPMDSNKTVGLNNPDGSHTEEAVFRCPECNRLYIHTNSPELNGKIRKLLTKTTGKVEPAYYLFGRMTLVKETGKSQGDGPESRKNDRKKNSKQDQTKKKAGDSKEIFIHV